MNTTPVPDQTPADKPTSGETPVDAPTSGGTPVEAPKSGGMPVDTPTSGGTPVSPAPLTAPGTSPGSASSTHTSRQHGARAVAIVAMAVGALVAVGTVGNAVAATAAEASVLSSGTAVSAQGVTGLRAEVGAGNLTVRFADVDRAQLQATGGNAGAWTLRRDSSDLVVSSPRNWFAWLGIWTDHDTAAVLSLPASLSGLDASFTVAAGALEADGDFAELDVAMGAGRTSISGSAEDVTVEVDAGRADVDLSGVRTVDFQISAGALEGRLTGTPPQKLTLGASAGSLRLTVPQGPYDVDSDVSAGRFDNRVGTQPGASSTVHVTVSAGEVVLRPAGDAR